MTVLEYKKLYGDHSICSQEYRDSCSAAMSGENNPNYNNRWTEQQRNCLSEKKQGQIPWNKGKKVVVTDAMKAGVESREQKYKSGEYIRKTAEKNIIHREKISKSLKQYAEENKAKISARAKQAAETKRRNGYDFGKPMRNRHHTQETREKIKISAYKNNIEKSNKSFQQIIAAVNKANLILMDKSGVYLTLQCKSCKTQFGLTKQYFNDSKFKAERCPTCFPVNIQRSKAEIELYEYVKTLCPDAQHNVRNIIGKSEIDIYIPSKQVAIEYNGLYWHSEQVLESVGKDKCSDNIKRLQLQEKNITYIGIFEDEWLNSTSIVKSRIANILGKSHQRIYARKCQIRAIDSKQASEFCRQNHIQSAGRSNVRYGLFYLDELVAVMTFSQNNLSRKIKQWELNRYCSKIGFVVIGAASKLFNHFVKEYSPDNVISYADSRWSIGDLYKQLGFRFVSNTVPNYWYVAAGTHERIHRFALRKPTNETLLTEKQLRDSQGYLRVWDCGSTKWQWKNKMAT
jgi:hypothetical protein